MTATLEDVEQLTNAFERDHGEPARAWAELLVFGIAVLEAHNVLNAEIGGAFHDFVLHCIDRQGVEEEEFRCAVYALQTLLDNMVAADGPLH